MQFIIALLIGLTFLCGVKASLEQNDEITFFALMSDDPHATKEGTAQLSATVYPFTIKVDEFSVLYLSESNSQVTNEDMKVWGRISDQYLSPRRFSERNRFVGSYSVSIEMDKGVIKNISWDDDCSACGDKNCLEDGCTYSCDGQSKEVCTAKMYIGWSGTDSRGRNLLSAGSLPRRFNKFQFTGMISDVAVGIWEDWAPT